MPAGWMGRGTREPGTPKIYSRNGKYGESQQVTFPTTFASNRKRQDVPTSPRLAHGFIIIPDANICPIKTELKPAASYEYFMRKPPYVPGPLAVRGDIPLYPIHTSLERTLRSQGPSEGEPARDRKKGGGRASVCLVLKPPLASERRNAAVIYE
ncbi:hypothetical protein Trydic_g3778 [Trypoxylus dichotomus]